MPYAMYKAPQSAVHARRFALSVSSLHVWLSANVENQNPPLQHRDMLRGFERNLELTHKPPGSRHPLSVLGGLAVPVAVPLYV